VTSSIDQEQRRPAFAKDFPRTAELDALVAAFEAGNYARVRDEAPRLAKATEDDAVRRAALTLRERIEADPLSKVLFILTGLLLAYLSAYWMMHDGMRNVEPGPPRVIEKIK
jgi:hypothetical protein